MRLRRRVQGLGALFVLGLLVIGSMLVAALARSATAGAQQAGDDIALAQARAAADSAIEWGRWNLLRGSWAACANQTATLDLRAESGMMASLTCNCTAYSEGSTSAGAPRATSTCVITAVACPSASCPDASADSARRGYVEWARRLTVRQ